MLICHGIREIELPGRRRQKKKNREEIIYEQILDERPKFGLQLDVGQNVRTWPCVPAAETS